MEHLAIGVLVSTGFAVWISQERMREFLLSHTGRVMLGATGILIALTSYWWHKGDWDSFVMQGGWFAACLGPVLVVAVIEQIKEVKVERLTKLNAPQAQLEWPLEEDANNGNSAS